MFSFMQTARVRRNLEQFASYADRDTLPGVPLNVRYFAGLQRLQQWHYPFDPLGEGPLLDFHPETSGSFQSLLHFMNIPALEEHHRCSEAEEARTRAGVAAGLLRLHAYDPAVNELLRLLVGAILFAKLEGHGGGSMGDTLGLVWLNPEDAVTPDDFAAKILHELTHQCLFVHQMVHAMFSVDEKRMHEPDMLIRSAILRIPRFYARSFHSATVAAMLTSYYDHANLPAEADPMFEGLAFTVQQLREVADRIPCLTDGGVEVLREMEDVVARRKAAR